MAQYTIVDLGDYGRASQARAISKNGEMSGVAILPLPGSIYHAAMWGSWGMRDLGTLGGALSWAYDINSSGTVVGWAHNAQNAAQPAVWTVDAANQVTATALPTLGGRTGVAWSINEAGLVVGNSAISPSSLFQHATLWESGQARDLGTLPGGNVSVAYDINNYGAVGGSSFDGSGKERAVLWTADGLLDLGGLSAGAWTAVQDVNDVGNTILWGSPSGFNRNHAAFWDGDAASPVIDLGTFGGTESWAWGLNNLGHVVGYAEEPNGIYKGFFWDGDTMLKLDTLGGPASSAFAINDEGVITGWAQDPVGVTHAVLWVPTGAPGDPGDGVPDATGTLFLVGPMFGLLAWFGAAGRRRRTKPDMSDGYAKIVDSFNREQ